MCTIELYQAILQTLPPLTTKVPRGASLSAFQDLERKSGIALPSELVNLYLHTDGNDDDIGVFSDYQFLSIAQVHDAIDALIEGASYFNELEPFPCHPEQTIKNIAYSKFWVPFAGKDSGNHIGVDLDPGVKGVSGQIINFGPDEFFRVQIAENFETFLEKLLTGYQRKEFHPTFSNSINIVDSIIGEAQRNSSVP